MSAGDDAVLAALDFPPPHLVRFGASNRLRGMVLDPHGRVARSLRLRVDGESVGDFPADHPSEDVATHLPQLSAARNCRFDFELWIPESAEVIEAATVWDNGRVEGLFEYDLAEVRRSFARLDRARRALDAIPMPPPDVVFLTQGHRDVEGYRNSIIPGVWNTKRYLAACRISDDEIRRVLDFGCGSGRLVTGWLLEGGDHVLAGCDSNVVLAEWANAHLPAARIEHTRPTPPLPYRDAEFDLVTTISVFTHLQFETQRLWARELARVLAPGGVLLVTLHGRSFVDLFARERLVEFDRAGHLEIDAAPEGSNEFSSFHSPRAVETVFDRFELLAHFPAGRIDGRRILFPLAGLQDVYVLRAR